MATIYAQDGPNQSAFYMDDREYPELADLASPLSRRDTSQQDSGPANCRQQFSPTPLQVKINIVK